MQSLEIACLSGLQKSLIFSLNEWPTFAVLFVNPRVYQEQVERAGQGIGKECALVTFAKFVNGIQKSMSLP